MLRAFPQPESLSRSGASVRSTTLRQRSARQLLWASLTCTVGLLSSTTALGFCFQNSCEDGTRKKCDNFLDPDDCTEFEYVCSRDENECINEGNTLHRTSRCMSFAVAKGNTSELKLTDQKLLEIVTSAFERWLNVDCGGGTHPGFQVPSVGLVAANSAYYCSRQDLNQSVWLLSANWRHDEKALGFTFSTSSLATGEVYDGDVELNLGKIQSDFSSDEWEAVLLSIATHEAGHFLGLAHSPDSNAVMFAAYNRSDLRERMLTRDDFDGICTIFPPDPALSCAPAVLVEAGLDESACLEAMSTPLPANSSDESSSEVETGPEDPLGEAVSRRGCNMGSGRRLPSRLLGLLALLIGVASMRRRSQ